MKDGSAKGQGPDQLLAVTSFTYIPSSEMLWEAPELP